MEGGHKPGSCGVQWHSAREMAAFGGPILAALRDVPPQIQDDFSDGRGWIGRQGGGEPLHPEWVSVSGGFIQAVNDGSRGYTHIQNDSKTNRVVNFVVTSSPAQRSFRSVW